MYDPHMDRDLEDVTWIFTEGSILSRWLRSKDTLDHSLGTCGPIALLEDTQIGSSSLQVEHTSEITSGNGDIFTFPMELTRY